jgi:hypothetical protein
VTYNEFLEDLQDQFSPASVAHLSFADEHDATDFFFNAVERLVMAVPVEDLALVAATDPRVLKVSFHAADKLTGKPERPSNLAAALRQVLTHLAMEHLEKTTLDPFLEETVSEEL